MDWDNRRLKQYLIVAAVSLATMTMGVSSAWPTPVIVKFVNNETSVHVNNAQISWMLALAAPGFVVGSLLTGYVADQFGRRTSILCSAIPISTGTVIVAFSSKVWLLYITRILWGIGTGMISTVINIYVAEIADKDIRGTLTIATKYMFNFGNLLVMVIGHYVSYETLNYMMLVLPICYFMGSFWAPETPYFYLKEGRVADAKKVLMVLRKYKDEKDLEEELSSLQADVKKEMRRSTSFFELMRGKQYRKAIFISAGLRLLVVLTGTVTTRNYVGQIMLESRSAISVDMVLIIFGGVSFVTSVMSSVLTDRVGRRPLLIMSFFGTGLSLVLAGAYFFCLEVLRIDPQSVRIFGFIPFVGIILSTVISTLGYGSLLFLIPAELFPLNIKSIAMTSLSVFGGILGFVVAKGYQEVKNVSGLFGVFWLFGGVAIVGALFSYFFIPETKGKSLKEIQILLQGEMYNCSNENLNQVAIKEDDNEEPLESTELKPINRKENEA